MAKHPPVEEIAGNNGGYPVVWGTRTPVRTIVKYYRWSGSVDEVVKRLGHLTREQVQEALDYYVANPARVDEDITRNERVWAERHGQPWPA
jgi:uncharacterized protein (DUF433 family)